jgi:SAM-dependent methyltransferase
MQKVNEPNYWKERLENAEKLDTLWTSVYITNKEDWDNICKSHKSIIGKLVSGKVLDAACGYGRISEWIEDYIGIDIAPAFINKAKQLYPGKKFIVGDISKTDFKDKEFDWVICVSLKAMIERELGSVSWAKIEYELKRISKHILLLEYSYFNIYETL